VAARIVATHPLLDAARGLYQQRRLRARYFAGSLFAEPMWDMLLDLFIADCERRRITVKSVCIGADVPTTTALRHLRWLHEQGLVERLSHPRDDRSTHIRLTAEAITAMENYLADISRA
jgi:Winged helix DNA-binding domain